MSSLGLKLLAIVISLATWTGVVYASNPPTTRTFEVHVPQDTTSIPSSFVRVQPVPDISVAVSGTRDHVTSFDPSMLRVVVDYGVVKHPGVQAVPLTISNLDPDVELDQPPTSVQVDIDSVGTATVPVKVVITRPPPQGYVTSASTVSPATISVTGPSRELAGMSAQVGVDLSSDKTNVVADLPVMFMDATGHQLTNVSATNPIVRVQITLATTATSRSSAVLPKTTGSVATGYELTGVTVTPATVTLAGSQSLLDSLDSVATQPVSLSGLTASETVTLTLAPPAGVTANPTVVSVTLQVSRISPSPTPSPTP
jgi:YbbR domain-containing protein